MSSRHPVNTPVDSVTPGTKKATSTAWRWRPGRPRLVAWLIDPLDRSKARSPGNDPIVEGSRNTTIEQVNYLAGHKSMAMTKRCDHANEERYGGAIEALDEAGITGEAEAWAAAR